MTNNYQEVLNLNSFSWSDIALIIVKLPSKAHFLHTSTNFRSLRDYKVLKVTLLIDARAVLLAELVDAPVRLVSTVQGKPETASPLKISHVEPLSVPDVRL